MSTPNHPTEGIVSMTRKDFELIAETLRYCDAHCDTDEETALVAWVAEKFGERLALAHPRFDVARFLKAAQVG
jgi:hypothetical protein